LITYQKTEFTILGKKHNIRINKDWGTSVGGKETLTSNQALPSEAYPSQLIKEGEEKVTLEQRRISRVNGKKDKPSKTS
jgi:argininosuccinate synthase